MSTVDRSKAIKTISSRLTAQFNADGSHLHRYLQRSDTIRSSICEDLILNDQILIPTQDYLTAAGLIIILGERSLIELLERGRINFIRTRCCFGFVRGSGPDGGLITFSDPKNLRPQDCDIERSVQLALNEISQSLKDKKLLTQLLVQSSLEEETNNILEKIGSEAILDFKRSFFWLDEYADEQPGLLRLPGIEKMQVKLASAGEDPNQGPIEFLLSLVLKNMDFYLLGKYHCQNISPFHSIGDFLNAKANRMNVSDISTLIEIMGVPNFSATDFTKEHVFLDFLHMTESKNALAFRKWFASLEAINEKEVLKEYISVLQDVPWIQRLPGKTFRFAITTFASLIPGAVGFVAGALDTFFLDSLGKKKSPKFFIDDLTKFCASGGK